MTKSLGMCVLLFSVACGLDQTPDLVDGGDVVAVEFNGGGGPPPPPPTCLRPQKGLDHKGLITNDTWPANTIQTISDNVTITGEVKVGPCAYVEIAAGKSITIQSGSLITTGGPTFIGRRDATAWGSIVVPTGGTLDLEATTVDGGGASSPMILVQGGTLIVHSAAIRNSAGVGLRVESGAIDATSSNLTVSGSSAAPVFIAANLVGSLPLGSYAGNAVDEIQIPTVSPWKVVSTSQTWHDQGVPYHVLGGDSLEVEAPTGVAVLTIEAGATLAFDRNTTLKIDAASGQTSPAAGALVVAGNAAAPVTFTSAAAPQHPGDWFGIWLGHKIDSHTKIDHAIISYAGATSTSSSFSCPTPIGPPNDAAIRMMHVPEPLTSFVTNTTILSSGKNGIDRGYHTSGSPADFTATNTFTGLPVGACPQTLPDGVCGPQPGC